MPVTGKKYHQPVNSYIGIIAPEGAIKSEKKVSLGGKVPWETNYMWT